jgi:tetratricopeptide (TPR) repeat protein
LRNGRPRLRKAGKYEVAERYLGRGDRLGTGSRATASRLPAPPPLGTTLIQLLRVEPAIAAREGALSDLSSLESDAEVASFSAQLARAYVDHDETGPALAWADRAIAAAERLDQVPVITDALITRGSAAWSQGRPRESRALFSGALALAERHELVASELRARSWLADLESLDDPTVAQELRKAGLELARRTGDRNR